MAISSRSISVLALSVLFCGLIVFNPATGVKQEIKWVFEDENSITFNENVPDMSIYNNLASRVKQFCWRGWWTFFSEVNYRGNLGPGGTLNGTELVCGNHTPPTYRLGMRHWGATETTVDAISLYSNVSSLNDEIYVEGKIHAGISTPILSVGATGTSDWTLFEGQQLDGKSICFEVPQKHYHYNWIADVRRDANLTTIGSVFKGCDLAEIQAYKLKHF